MLAGPGVYLSWTSHVPAVDLELSAVGAGHQGVWRQVRLQFLPSL